MLASVGTPHVAPVITPSLRGGFAASCGSGRATARPYSFGVMITLSSVGTPHVASVIAPSLSVACGSGRDMSRSYSYRWRLCWPV